ncbi:MAG: helix-turn-helix transcriptional regulator [Rhodospirillaceae bacterium]|nr:helix-turn-helix transcriptional regulator [Rhodospirillaceae bacterium]
MPEARFSGPADAPDFAELIDCGGLVEQSRGDAKSKIVHVRSGRFRLEGPRGVWRILPAHMVFIPAERAYAIRTDPRTQVAVVHLDPRRLHWHHDGCWVSEVTPLAREMILYALRWPRGRDPADPVADAFFRTVGLLCRDWFSKERILWQPAGQSPEIGRAIQYALAHLEEASIERAAAAACLSARTLRRRFKAETGMTWRRFVHDTRMTQAMDLLAAGRVRVSEVALSVGFRSVGAFTHAFTALVGKTPSAFARDQRATRGGAAAAATYRPAAE